MVGSNPVLFNIKSRSFKLTETLSGKIISDCTDKSKIALTFDDGPYNFTSQLLDILQGLGVTASFFITGNNLGKGHIDNSSLPWASILRRMHSAGHQLASHTWTHRDLEEVNSTIRHTEIIYNEMAFRNIFGFFPVYLRPPYLDCTAEEGGCLDVLTDLGYHVIYENLDTKDYLNDAPGLIQNSKDTFSSDVSTNTSGNEYIVLSHDIHYQTVINLTSYMVSTAKARGYTLVPLGECLNDPSENWYRNASGGSSEMQSTSAAGTPSATTASPVSSTSSFPTPVGTVVASPDQT
jgi:peptidoglycan/xylan/chitin deacetylase (PgdA/CDA1 family)